MRKKKAKAIVKLLKNINFLETNYQVEEEVKDKYLSNFHPWADGKNHIRSFLIREKKSKTAFWFTFNEWNSNFGYYLIIFPENRKVPLIEIQKNENESLIWKYKPTKQDGKNLERKNYFINYFKTVDVRISAPTKNEEILDFLDEVFNLIDVRIKSDILSSTTPDKRDGFIEGKRIERMHYGRERNSKLIEFVKKVFKEKNGSLFCEVCNFNFEKVYGKRGVDYIEAHHTRPLSELDIDGEKTKPEEIVLVCSNCHKIIHRTRPWLNIEKIKSLLK